MENLFYQLSNEKLHQERLYLGSLNNKLEWIKLPKQLKRIHCDFKNKSSQTQT